MEVIHQHEEKKRTNSKKVVIICLVSLIVIVAVISVWIIFFRQNTQALDTSMHNNGNSLVKKNEDTISIPGYEGITLEADSLEQTISLNNPAQNNCYFVIALYLEDGTMLWQSDYIKPGEVSAPIVLSRSLEKGNYPNAVLQYSCFKMDGEKTPLNGAQTELTLRVK